MEEKKGKKKNEYTPAEMRMMPGGKCPKGFCKENFCPKGFCKANYCPAKFQKISE
jgi:hypothetical protein